MTAPAMAPVCDFFDVVMGVLSGTLVGLEELDPRGLWALVEEPWEDDLVEGSVPGRSR
jgi:hypothetical protein